MFKTKTIILSCVFFACVFSVLVINGPADVVEAIVTSTATPTEPPPPTTPPPPITPTPCPNLPCSGVAPSQSSSLSILTLVLGLIFLIGYWILATVSRAIKQE